MGTDEKGVRREVQDFSFIPRLSLTKCASARVFAENWVHIPIPPDLANKNRVHLRNF